MTASLLCVLPVIDEQIANRCVESLVRPDSAAGLDHDSILVVDNSREGFAYASHRYDLRVHRDPDGHNIGVARSWNVGAREVLDRGLDYLLIMSASMQFGPILHTTWVEQMERFWGENVIECDGHSWHLIAFHRRVFEAVGLFCEGYWPAYIEGLDFSYKMRQVGMEGGWRRCWVNAMSTGVAAHLPLVECPFKPLNELYIARWGGEKGEETFTVPYGNQPLDFDADIGTPIPELAARYGITNWW